MRASLRLFKKSSAAAAARAAALGTPPASAAGASATAEKATAGAGAAGAEKTEERKERSGSRRSRFRAEDRGDDTKAADSRRQARETPLWDNIVFTAGMTGAAVGAAGIVYAARRAYFYLRVDGDDLAVNNSVDNIMHGHPDWSAAMVYTTVHHAFAPPGAPFGSPLLVPAEFEEEIRLLEKELRKVAVQYQISMPDMWAAAARYSVSTMGGPLPDMHWDRVEPEPLPPSEALKIVQKVVSFDLSTEASKAKQSDKNNGGGGGGFLGLFGGKKEATKSVDINDTILKLKRHMAGQGFTPEEIAALAGHRTLGCHGANGKRQLALLADVATRGGSFLKDAEAARQSKPEDDKAPVFFTAPSAETPASGSCTPGVFDNNYFVTLNQGHGAWAAAKGRKEFTSESVPHVQLEALDVALLDDGMLRGWAEKFASNEVKFMVAFQKAVEKICLSGWDVSDLRV